MYICLEGASDVLKFQTNFIRALKVHFTYWCLRLSGQGVTRGLVILTPPRHLILLNSRKSDNFGCNGGRLESHILQLITKLEKAVWTLAFFDFTLEELNQTSPCVICIHVKPHTIPILMHKMRISKVILRPKH
jgi:hypothetical protein